MEFVYYWLHRAYHKVPFLWRIHAAHHSDTEVDVTTSYRHHPFEVIVSALIITPVIFMLGAPAITIAIYHIVNTTFSLVTHSNIRVPEKVDSLLRLFVVTPDFHRLHHSSNIYYTDSNYSAVIPLFDYLFKTTTRMPYKDVPDMELGLEIMRNPKENRLDGMLMTPFRYRAKRVV